MNNTMKRIKIVALGDSITKGVVLDQDNNYSVTEGSFVEILKKEQNLDIDNYGRFGCTINYGHQIINRHAEEIAAAQYTIIEYGGNDCDFYWKRIAVNPEAEHLPKTTIRAFCDSLRLLIDRVRALGSTPLILSLPPIISDSYFAFFSRSMDTSQKDNILGWMGGEVESIERWHENYNSALFTVANETNTPILDITHPFDDYEGGWRALICPDGIHPNSLGHRLIANSIMNAVSF